MQQRGAELDGDAAGDHRHRQQQRQHAVLGHRLERHRGEADVEQAPGQRGLGGQVQVAEQQVALLQQGQVAGDRLLHLDDQLAGLVQRGGVRHHRDAFAGIRLIDKAAVQAGTGLDEHLVAAVHQVGGGGRNERDAPFHRLGFAGNADAHGEGIRWKVEPIAPSSRPRRRFADALNRCRVFPILAGSCALSSSPLQPGMKRLQGSERRTTRVPENPRI